MRFTSFIAVMLLCFAFSGCGGGSSSSNPPGSTFTITSGNWDFGAASNSGAQFIIGGIVTQSGSNIVGTLRVINSACFDITVPVPVTGNVSGQTATVTSASVAGQIISATLTGSANALTGTYIVTGTGCAAGDKGTLSGSLVPSISGTWAGTFVSSAIGNPQIGVTSPITEGSFDATGIFTLTGTAAFSGSPCFSTGTFATGSGMAGRVSDVIIKNNDGSTAEFVGLMTNPAAPTQMTGTYTVTGGLCDGDSGTGTLTKQ